MKPKQAKSFISKKKTFKPVTVEYKYFDRETNFIEVK